MASDIVITRPDEAAIRTEYAPLVEAAVAVTVTTRDEHEAAQRVLRDLRAAQKRVTERLDPIIRSAHAAHKGLTTLRADLLQPVEAAVSRVSRALDSYEREQKRLADEARRAAEAEARRLEEERRLLEAIEVEEAGDAAGAEEILAAPLEMPAVIVEPATARVEGVSTRQTWRADVTDLPALVGYVAAHPEWARLVEPNMPALNALARSQQAALAIPGVRAVAETVRQVRVA